MLAQKLRHRVDIEREAPIQNMTTGALVNTWTLYAGREPADVVPLSGREFIAAQAEQAGVTTRITMRADAGILPSMRVRHLGVVYNIRAVLPDPSFRKHVNLMCEGGVPSPPIEPVAPPTNGNILFNGDELSYNGDGVTYNYGD